MKKHHITFVAVILLLIGLSSNAQTDTNLLEALKSGDYAKGHQIVDLLTQERANTISNLISILDTNYPAEVKIRAAIVLGNYRASEAITNLLNNIGLDSRPGILGLIPVEYMLPSTTALVKIGSPAVPALIKVLEEEDKGPNRALLLVALCLIDGDKDIMQLRLEKALKKEADLLKQARLQEALKQLADPSFQKVLSFYSSVIKNKN